MHSTSFTPFPTRHPPPPSRVFLPRPTPPLLSLSRGTFLTFPFRALLYLLFPTFSFSRRPPTVSSIFQPPLASLALPCPTVSSTVRGPCRRAENTSSRPALVIVSKKLFFRDCASTRREFLNDPRTEGETASAGRPRWGEGATKEERRRAEYNLAIAQRDRVSREKLKVSLGLIVSR